MPLSLDARLLFTARIVRLFAYGFSISQMDVPTRQAFVIAAVEPAERTAVAGITGVARTTGAALAPIVAMPLIASLTHDWVPFVAAGALKVLYDLALLWSCRNVKLEG